MPEFDTARIRRYYDRNTADFVAYGQGGSEGAIHRAVWGPGADDRRRAFHFVEERIAHVIRDRVVGAAPAHVVDLGCGIGASLCYLAERLPPSAARASPSVLPRRPSAGGVSPLSASTTA